MKLKLSGNTMKKWMFSILFLLATFGLSGTAMAKCNFVGTIKNSTGKEIKVYKVSVWEKVNTTTIVMNKDRKVSNGSTLSVRKTLSGWWGKKCGNVKSKMTVYFKCVGSRHKQYWVTKKKSNKGRRITNHTTITKCSTERDQ